MRRKTLYTFILSIFVLFVSYYLYLKIKDFMSSNDQLVPNDPVVEGESPMHMETFRLTETDGMALNWFLNSKSADMFRDQNLIVFKQVFTEINTDQGKSKYSIYANSGTYYVNSDKIALRGDVKIVTSNGYEFETDAVLYNSKYKKIITNLPVTAFGPRGGENPLFIKGVGLKGDIDSGDFEFTKRVITSKGDDGAPSFIEVNSGSALFNTKVNKVEFRRNVVAKRNDMDIKGEYLYIDYNETGSINKLNVKENVVLGLRDGTEKISRTAYCGEADIDVKSNRIVLMDNPELKYSDDIIVGEKIILFTDSDEVQVEKVKAEVTEGSIN